MSPLRCCLSNRHLPEQDHVLSSCNDKHQKIQAQTQCIFILKRLLNSLHCGSKSISNMNKTNILPVLTELIIHKKLRERIFMKDCLKNMQYLHPNYYSKLSSPFKPQCFESSSSRHRVSAVTEDAPV